MSIILKDRGVEDGYGPEGTVGFGLDSKADSTMCSRSTREPFQDSVSPLTQQGKAVGNVTD